MLTKQMIRMTVALIAITFVAEGCKKKKKKDDDDDESTTTVSSTGTGGGSSSGSLASVYPGELALAVFTDSSSSALRLAEDEAATEAQKPIKERAAEEEKIAKGEAESCFSPALSRQSPMEGAERCYEFDQDLVYGGKGSTNPPTDLLGTKNGLNSDGEACLVAFAKDRAAGINDMIDKAKGMVATMLCQAKKVDSTVSLPAAVGDELDLKAVLSDVMGAKGKATIDTAKVERLADNSDGNPVYRSTVKMVFDNNSRTVIMVHSPSAADASAYRGSMTTIGTLGGQAGKQGVLTIVYAKESAGDGTYRLSAELRRAAVADALVDGAVDTDGQLDFNAHRDFSVATTDPNYGKGKKADGSYYTTNDDLGGQVLIRFSINPDTDEGTFAYWQNPGSNYNEAARGLVASVAVEGGVKKGCATSGAAFDATNFGKGHSIASSIKEGVELNPNGFYHPFYNVTNGSCSTGSDADGSYHTCTITMPAGYTKWYVPAIADAALAGDFVSDQRGGIVTRQCYAFDAATGLYAIDTDEITEDAGYELFRNTDTSKFVALPVLGDKVKPFDGGAAKPE